MNRVYTDDRGKRFRSIATPLQGINDAAMALRQDVPIIYTTTAHATVQVGLIIDQYAGQPIRVTGGTIWDPMPGVGLRALNEYDRSNYVAAWSIKTEDIDPR